MKITVEFNSIEEQRAWALEIVRETIGQTIDKAVTDAVEDVKAEQKPAKAKKAEPKAEEAPAETQEQLPFNVDETEVKTMLTAQLKAGKKLGIKALFSEYGVSKLSELIETQPDKLQEFYDKARAI